MKEPVTVPERRRTDTIAVPSAGSIDAPTQRQTVVPSTSSVDAILDEIRKPAASRISTHARIAEGGMGVIDIGVDKALDRHIAIKTLHGHLRGDENTVRMFLREARLTGLLDHPHVVPVYDIGERPNGELWFAMKLVEGRTLGDVIRALPPTALDIATLYELLDVVMKICDALAFAHSRGVIHCDIKPSNVMVGEFGQVYVMDWGIARLVATEAAPGSIGNPAGPARTAASETDHSVIGTPAYMSPEQARGDRAKLDERSDVFLLGALLYEVVTRRPPYASRDRAETLSLAAAAAFPPPRKAMKFGVVPPDLERIVLRAMSKDPNARYPTMMALREDLAQFMRGGAEFPKRSFSPDEVIVREGDPGEAAFIIVSGKVAISKVLPERDEEHVFTLGPGDVFGEMAILTDGPRTATVTALEATTVLVVTGSTLEQEMSALKPWMATLLRSLAARFRDVDTKHRATYASSPAPARLANQVLMHLTTWGTHEGTRCSMKWSHLAREIEGQLGSPPLAIFGALTRYGMQLDAEADLLIVADLPALRDRLHAELKAPRSSG